MADDEPRARHQIHTGPPKLEPGEHAVFTVGMVWVPIAPQGGGGWRILLNGKPIGPLVPPGQDHGQRVVEWFTGYLKEQVDEQIEEFQERRRQQERCPPKGGQGRRRPER